MVGIEIVKVTYKHCEKEMNVKNLKKKHIEMDIEKRKLVDKGPVGGSCREGGSTTGREKFRFAPPPVVSSARKGKVFFQAGRSASIGCYHRIF